MSGVDTGTIFALTGAVLIGIGVYGLLVRGHMLRRLIAFNVMSSGIFLMFGATGARGPAAAPDPVPQALIITGLVVALAATALVVALLLRYAQITGRAALSEDMPGEDDPA
ncbi:NADH-quinone oxidoreductase subunit K [Tranquillimonas alkanivorans]|uniref:Multisubunit sodium/proton antiporter, MrpC subunit n=1 Tax=Tranquillimonas alkanivorans TaxID=441119 RepID=A0A1I5Q139_9RHOB|nr:NADH-quinone oxidoreductase subunit K [Tranquillimonas alkanivorans]SFP39721.1 multisubunit sodium/proton antiporter, MrpC subunit [Tranquillimonas alkanivorans]